MVTTYKPPNPMYGMMTVTMLHLSHHRGEICAKWVVALVVVVVDWVVDKHVNSNVG